jgi:hypothetical protein
MRYQQIVSLILAVLIFAASAEAQTGDWQAVRNLPPGAFVTVKTQYRFDCYFRGASEEELTCGHPGPGSIGRGSSAMRIDRKSVREVRLEHMSHGNPVIGALIGGGLGAVGGARDGTGTRDHAAGAVFIGGFGAFMGAWIAWMIPIFHRKVIYRR